MCRNCQAALWTDAFRPKAFDEASHDDNSEKKGDEKGNFPKTDRHAFNLRCFLHADIESLQVTPSNPVR
ncbi:MAG: hypothetical protein OXH00_06095 [Candidatus Poribacteria bacterium]|nr:hypothetical protein [Candidatus Poribacteria bacterium]